MLTAHDKESVRTALESRGMNVAQWAHARGIADSDAYNTLNGRSGADVAKRVIAALVSDGLLEQPPAEPAPKKRRCEPVLVGPEDVAAMLGMTESGIRKWEAERFMDFPRALHLGRVVRYDIRAVKAWLQRIAKEQGATLWE